MKKEMFDSYYVSVTDAIHRDNPNMSEELYEPAVIAVGNYYGVQNYNTSEIVGAYHMYDFMKWTMQENGWE